MATLEKLRKDFAKKSQNYKDQNVYCGIVIGELEDLSLKTWDYGYCHASLKAPCDLPDKPIQFVLSSVQTLRAGEDEASGYFHWLINDSPWAPVFITKDVQEGLDLGWLVDVDQPHQLVISAMIASRFPTESHSRYISDRFVVYTELRKLGYNEAVSYLFANLFYKSISTAKGLYPLTYNAISAGHLPFEFNEKTEAHYRNFLNNTPTLEPETFSENRGYGYGVTNIWGKRSHNAFNRFMKQVSPKVKEAAINYNIFYKQAEVGNLINTPADFKDVVDQILERIYQ